MFELHGGVIIGDVVGLGKTYVGISLLKYLQIQEYRPLIICPPSLIPMWEKFCVDYEVDAKFLSRGQLSQENFELSQNYRYKDRDLILIDESHHFRNNNSRQYENLHLFMQLNDAKAILLTATPYSNKTTDIKNQIMLFHQSEKTSIPPANQTDLNRYFRDVEKGNANLVELLRNIMVRRTRRYVLKHWGKIDDNGRNYLQVGDDRKYFPNRMMETIRYDINKVYHNNYRIIEKYLSQNSLTLARYSLGLYVKESYRHIDLYKELGMAGSKLVGLMRVLLLKRMESSIEAFKDSIKHYVNTHEIFLKLLDEKIIPIGDISYKAMYDIAQSDPDSINDPETIEEFKKRQTNAGETKYKFEAFDIDKLVKNIENDKRIFEKIHNLISDITTKDDDKLHKLQELLDNEYFGKKILIFTEFATTAKYLNKHLKYPGKKAQVDASTNNALSCARKFDPYNNPSNEPIPTESEQISLLISTDVLSEGVNLQAGEVIINYDFHWNPTRLIQRAGRIDRIGSKNESIMIHNFLLDPMMEADFGLEHIVKNKINDIQEIIGNDFPTLEKNEVINPNDMYAVYKKDKSILDREGDNPLEPSRFEQILHDLYIHNPKFWEELKDIPDGIRSSDNVKRGGRLLLACEGGTGRSGRIRKYYLIAPDGKIDEIRAHKALQILESNDKSTHQIIPKHDDLLSIGWRRFVEDIDQIQAMGSTIKTTMAQKWIIEKLIKIGKNKRFENQKEIIETLRKAYCLPIQKGKLNRELLKIKKGDMNDADIISSLTQLYLYYDLQNKVKKQEEEISLPRILYSKYLGDTK